MPLKRNFQDVLPLKSEIFEYWKDKLGELQRSIDWGEPSCWACGFHYDGKYDIKRRNPTWENILNCWDRIPLQRCHIIPRALGGPDTVDNLFLLCRECHDAAPNTNAPDIFFAWVNAQDYYVRELAKMVTAFNAFGVTEEDYPELEVIFRSEEFRKWNQGRLSLHRPQSNYAARSSRLTPSTYIGLALLYKKEMAEANLVLHSNPRAT
jgi:HNH endonuclease